LVSVKLRAGSCATVVVVEATPQRRQRPADVDRAIDALEQATVGGGGTYHAARDGSYLPAGYYEPALFHLADPRCAARRPH
jgi:hypothetical protein